MKKRLTVGQKNSGFAQFLFITLVLDFVRILHQEQTCCVVIGIFLHHLTEMLKGRIVENFGMFEKIGYIHYYVK